MILMNITNPKKITQGYSLLIVYKQQLEINKRRKVFKPCFYPL